jgi:polar amino acid transport system substrate-binding protein
MVVKKMIIKTKYFLIFFLLFLTEIAHAKTLKVCYDKWPPLTIFPSEVSNERGIVIDMVDQIYTSEGYKLEYYEVPLARGLDMVTNGLCDMLPEYVFSNSSELGFVYAKEPTFTYKTAFVVRQNDSWQYNGIASIKGRRIATGPGWDYSSMSADYQNYLDDPKNSHLIEVIAGNDDVVDRVMKMINENRVDLYADNDLVLQYVLNRLKLNDHLKIVRPGLENKLVEIPIFSNKLAAEKRQELINIWNNGRLSMKGKKEKMLFEKYNIVFEE